MTHLTTDSATINPMTINEIKEGLDILSEISGLVPLIKSGKSHVGLCPFHTEGTPSFHVYPDSQSFYCYGCRTGGDVIEFYMKYNNMTFPEVVQELANITDAQPTEEEIQEFETEHQKEEILAVAAEFCNHRLSADDKTYLLDRGITEESIDREQLGSADEALTELLLSKFTKDVCIAAGVLRDDPEGAILHFQHHIIIPIRRGGRIVSLIGRTTDNSRGPKYLLLPGSRDHMYGEDSLINTTIAVVEGPFDAITLNQAGCPAVALIGTSLKQSDVCKFESCSRIYICLDGDEPGRAASVKVADQIGDAARIVDIPGGQDPNEYIQTHSIEEWDGLVSEARDQVEHQIYMLPDDVTKKNLRDSIEPVLQQLVGKDPATQEVYLSQIKDRFALKREELSAYRSIIRGRHDSKVIGSPAKKCENLTAQLPGLIDLVLDDDDEVSFLMSEGDGPEAQREISHEGVEYTPPGRSDIPYSLVSASDVIDQCKTDTDAALLDDLIEYHRNISDLDERWYRILAIWDMHTWMLEKVNYSPIMVFHAVAERGKTRTIRGMTLVSYRGIVTESLRESYLIRHTNAFGGVICFDVMSLWKKAEKSQSEDVIIQRFERGSLVPRVNRPEAGPFRDTDYYSIFGATIIATNESLHKILDTRAITYTMGDSERIFPDDVTDEEAIPLKARLTAFKARHMETDLPEVDKPARGRLGDILRPFRQIVRLVCPKWEDEFMAWVEDVDQERRSIKSDSIEGQFLQVVAGSLDERLPDGRLPISIVTKGVNEQRDIDKKLSSSYVSRKLHTMGFKKGSRTMHGGTFECPDRDFNRIAADYGIKGVVNEDIPESEVDETTHGTIENQTAHAADFVPAD